MSNIASNIVYLRELLCLKQKEFGALFGLTRDNIASYERGAEPKIATLLTIVNYFHISVEVIVNTDLKSEGFQIGDEFEINSEKLAPKMAPNVAPNSEKEHLNISKEPQPYIYSGEQPDIEEDTDRRMEVILYQNELLEERERTIYALNEVINAQKDALKAQKALINEYETQLGQLESSGKPNRKTAG